MKRLLIVIVRAYLEVFVTLASDRTHARQEHGLLLGSIQYLYDASTSAGTSARRAFLMSVWNHLGELQPFALYAKTRADAELTSKPQAATPFFQLSRAVVFGLAIAIIGLVVVLLMTAFLLWPQRQDR